MCGCVWNKNSRCCRFLTRGMMRGHGQGRHALVARLQEQARSISVALHMPRVKDDIDIGFGGSSSAPTGLDATSRPRVVLTRRGRYLDSTQAGFLQRIGRHALLSRARIDRNDKRLSMKCLFASDLFHYGLHRQARFRFVDGARLCGLGTACIPFSSARLILILAFFPCIELRTSRMFPSICCVANSMRPILHLKKQFQASARSLNHKSVFRRCSPIRSQGSDCFFLGSLPRV